MKILKQTTALIIALLLLFSAAQADWQPAGENVPRFLELLGLLDESVPAGGVPDGKAVDAVLNEIRRENTDDYDIACAIVDHWNATVADRYYRMFAYKGQDRAYALERSGLDFGGKHAFVVLGFQLQDGEMQEELIGRCDAAVAAARSYPDAVIITTGGATGPNNEQGHTEAGLMKEYMVRQGIDPGRIYTETEAMNTLDNAVNTFRILRDLQIDTITIVTSNYHQRWGQILFNAMAAVYEKDTGYRIRIVGNFNYMARPKASRLSSVRVALGQLSALFTGSIPTQKERP